MIDVQEHVYADDPAVGPADVRTRLRNVSYFFLGNGFIQAAVQWAPSGEGTPLGLLLMDPDVLGPKRRALTMDPASGLEGTMISLAVGGRRLVPEPGSVAARWDEEAAWPTVCVSWGARPLKVEERFFCPDLGRPALIRDVRVVNPGHAPVTAVFQTAAGIQTAMRELTLAPGAAERLTLEYGLDRARARVGLRFVDAAEPAPRAVDHWRGLASASFGSPLLDRIFRASKFQLAAAASAAGRIDGGIWQYNREWVRDQSVIAAALSMLGDWGLARTVLDRLWSEFVTDDGGTVDSSERRGPEDIELDQAGFLLQALETYALWSGDLDLVAKHWPRISAAAAFPLRPEFRHERCGLLVNSREFWERHFAHGITPGMELVHQVYAAGALTTAASLGAAIGRTENAALWAGRAEELKTAVIGDAHFGLVRSGRLIKRRNRDGSEAELIRPRPDSGLPPGVPLAGKGKHWLNPDTSAVLPIALGFVDGGSALARRTLRSVEKLWNQGWSGGGYGRYHWSSEPDSPGPWPFPSLFVARAYVEAGDPGHAAKILRWLGTVPGAASGAWFEYYGERKSPPFPQVGIIPWTWAEAVTLFVHHMIGLRPALDGIVVRPRLLPGIDRVEAQFPLRDRRLKLEVVRERGLESVRAEANCALSESAGESVRLSYPESGDIELRLVVPV